MGSAAKVSWRALDCFLPSLLAEAWWSFDFFKYSWGILSLSWLLLIMVALSEQSRNSSFSVFVRDSYQAASYTSKAVWRSPCGCISPLLLLSEAVITLNHLPWPVRLPLYAMSGKLPRRTSSEGSNSCRSLGSTIGRKRAFGRRCRKGPSNSAWGGLLALCQLAWIEETNVMTNYESFALHYLLHETNRALGLFRKFNAHWE